MKYKVIDNEFNKKWNSDIGKIFTNPPSYTIVEEQGEKNGKGTLGN